VGYGESGSSNASHAIGGLQSFSYWPVPTANKQTHWAAQQQWASDHGLAIKRVLAHNYIDTYLFHHNVSEVVGPSRKPWRLSSMQLKDGICNCTLYVGGAASFETVEDVFHHNLQLVHTLFDDKQTLATIPLPASAMQSSATSRRLPSSLMSSPPFPHNLPPRAFVLEQLVTIVPCVDVDHFLRTDAAVWTAFLSRMPGFVRKASAIVRSNSQWSEVEAGHPDESCKTTASPSAQTTVCKVWSAIEWYSRTLWKAIPPAELIATRKSFATAYGARVPPPTPVPAHANGLTIQSRVPRELAYGPDQVIETLTFEVAGCIEGVTNFMAADNATYTVFLQSQPGFVGRERMVDDAQKLPAQNCTVWVRTRWQSEAAYCTVCAPGHQAAACAKVHKEFVSVMGSDPPMVRLPLRTVAHDAEAPFGPRLAVLGGIDVVAYHQLSTGSHDVWGSPAYRRWLKSTAVLPPNLYSFHPRPYEFWFASEVHARAFEVDPMRFLPAFGGHCTHGIATRNDLNQTLLADGRVAFSCINGSSWVVLNGTLYLSSCGMFPDFDKQPERDVALAHATWRGWFGSYFGPLNDACVQDAAEWGDNPIGGLIPVQCVLN